MYQQADINEKDREGFTPLHWAAEKGHLSVVEYLLHRGADFQDRIKGQSYLHWAAEEGHLSVVEYLVDQKADINAQSSGYPSGTPLHLAVHNGHLSVVEYLVNQKADINAKDKYVELIYLIGLLFIGLLKMVI